MLFFFDIDGTLLIKPFDPMPVSTIRAIEQARENGHICMINTGRSLKLVGDDITGQTEFDGLLLGCGTMITYHGEVLFHKVFAAEEAKQIIEGLQRYGIDEEKTIFWHRNRKCFMSIGRNISESLRICPMVPT